jgi:hypothetical protein
LRGGAPSTPGLDLCRPPEGQIPSHSVKTRIATLVAGLALALPALATAERAAVGGQRLAIERAAGLAGTTVPQRCLRVEITTKDGGRWATVGFNAARAQSCQRWGFNGVTIVHRARLRWRMVTSGSAEIPCGRYRIPPAVRQDLSLPCRA